MSKQNEILSLAAASELTKLSLEEVRVLALELVSQSLRQDEQIEKLQARIIALEEILRSIGTEIRQTLPARAKSE